MVRIFGFDNPRARLRPVVVEDGHQNFINACYDVHVTYKNFVELLLSRQANSIPLIFHLPD